MLQDKASKLLFTALAALAISSGNLFAQSSGCPTGYQPSGYTHDAAGKEHIISCTNPTTGDYWIAGQIADAGGQVENVTVFGARGDDKTDDTAAVKAARDALPSCHIDVVSWNHCGHILFPPGVYKLSSGVSFNSPFVTVRGSGPSATIIDASAIGSGPAFYFTGHDASIGNTGGGIDGLTILGGTRAGTYGLETQNILGFHIQNVTIANFTGAGSAGWLDDTTGKEWNERFHVESLNLHNNTAGWKISLTNTSGGNPTFGYGQFDIYFDVEAGQIGIDCEGNGTMKPLMTYSTMHLMFNMRGESPTAIKLANSAKWFSNLLSVHAEGGLHPVFFSIDTTSSFIGIGSVESNRTTNSIAAGGVYQVLSDTGTPDSGSIPYFEMPVPDSSHAGFSIGNQIDCGKSNHSPLQVCEPANDTQWPFAIMRGGTFDAFEDNRGGWHAQSIGTGGYHGPTWTSGSGAPSGSCTTGSLYSNTSGTSGSTFYSCVAGKWADIK